MEKLDYGLNPLEHSNQSNENVLLTICENSEGSQDLMTSGSANEDVQYEVRNADGVLQYRFLCTSPENNSANGNITPPAGNAPTVQSTNCQFYVINDLSANRPCLISPKVIDDASCNRHIIVGNSKKRDEKRRATHNEVERRRRDKINHWIYKLKDLLPDNADPKPKTNGNDSKGGILIKACEYIRKVQDDIQSLRECLKQSEKLALENAMLKERIEELGKENRRLAQMVGDKTIKMENNFEYDSS